MKRTTIVELVNAVRVLNVSLGYPDCGAAAIGVDPIPGSFVLQGAYGGWQLQRVHPSGGVESVTTGYRSKREVKEMVEAIRYGAVIGSLRFTGATV
jgi:hypothetical protein